MGDREFLKIYKNNLRVFSNNLLKFHSENSTCLVVLHENTQNEPQTTGNGLKSYKVKQCHVSLNIFFIIKVFNYNLN